MNSNRGSGNAATNELADAIAKLDPAKEEMLVIECETPTEARGYGRRLNKALEMLKLPSTAVKINAYDAEQASKAYSEGKPILRYIQRVK